jgi:hypothetical protein
METIFQLLVVFFIMKWVFNLNFGATWSGNSPLDQGKNM